MSGGNGGAPVLTRDEMESELRDAVSECMLSKWQLCAAGVAVGVPVSIRMKSFLPFLAGGAVGTVADLANAYYDCADKREALDTFMGGGGDSSTSGS